MLSPIITNNLTQLQVLCKTHYVKELYVFGSAARNEMKEDSDVDFLYTMDGVPLLETADNFFDLLWKLEEVFKRKVDLVNETILENKYFIRELNETKQLIYNG